MAENTASTEIVTHNWSFFFQSSTSIEVANIMEKLYTVNDEKKCLVLIKFNMLNDTI